MTLQAVPYRYYNNYTYNHETYYNQSPNRYTVGSKNDRRHHYNDGSIPPSSKKSGRMAKARNESITLKKYLQERQWLPRPDSESEQQRKVVLKSLEMVLCQWASSLQSIRPNGQNRWQRPRGKSYGVCVCVSQVAEGFYIFMDLNMSIF
jgi:hypothetical protein